MKSKQESFGGIWNLGIPRNEVMGTSVMLFVGTTLSPTITDPSVIEEGLYKG